MTCILTTRSSCPAIYDSQKLTREDVLNNLLFEDEELLSLDESRADHIIIHTALHVEDVLHNDPTFRKWSNAMEHFWETIGAHTEILTGIVNDAIADAGQRPSNLPPLYDEGQYMIINHAIAHRVIDMEGE